MSEDVPLMPEKIGPSHYYGDTVRLLFVVSAVLMLAAQLVGTAFLTPAASLISAVVLVIAAGLTNPVQAWIHFVNAGISALGLVACGSIVLSRYQDGSLIGEGLIVLILTILFLIALYCSVKTLRGTLMRDAPEIK